MGNHAEVYGETIVNIHTEDARFQHCALVANILEDVTQDVDVLTNLVSCWTW